VFTKFSVHNSSHTDVHRIYDLTVVHLFKCFYKLGPRAVDMLQAPRHLNPALVRKQHSRDDSFRLSHSDFETKDMKLKLEIYEFFLECIL